LFATEVQFLKCHLEDSPCETERDLRQTGPAGSIDDKLIVIVGRDVRADLVLQVLKDILKEVCKRGLAKRRDILVEAAALRLLDDLSNSTLPLSEPTRLLC
jgi:hypothetical protein